MKAIIMAGGTGTRLWPVSRKNSPKQGQPLGGQETMVQKTFQRLHRGYPASHIFVSTSVSQYAMLQKQLPALKKNQFILETARRETAAAIGLVTMYLWKRNPKDMMFTASSDHYFKEVPEYLKVLKAAEGALKQHPNRTILMGVKPTMPHTGLGYIKMKSQVGTIQGHEVFSVDKFIEKPNLATAKRFVSEWQYLWNIGAFMFRVDAMMEKYRLFLPKSHALLLQMAKSVGTKNEAATIKRLFPKMDKISVDYGIMEHDKNMLVLPADVTWADIGSWREVYEMLATNPKDNVALGRHVHLDSHGNLIYSTKDKVVATAGLKNMIIIETPDALLICPKDRAQDVKQLVAELERQKLDRYL